MAACASPMCNTMRCALAKDNCKHVLPQAKGFNKSVLFTTAMQCATASAVARISELEGGLDWALDGVLPYLSQMAMGVLSQLPRSKSMPPSAPAQPRARSSRKQVQF